MRAALVALMLLGGTAAADSVPQGFTAWPSSISPDKKLGVIVPDIDHVKDGERQNKLIELATGKVVAVIEADTVFAHQNHATIAPKWTQDGTLIWYVDGKWGSFALVVLHLENGVVKWQTDVREAAVKQVLEAARKAKPAAYAAAKEQGKRTGSWYRDGFAIEVRPKMSLAGTDLADSPYVKGPKPALPLQLVIELTSDPKNLDDYPKAAKLEGTMTATLGANGKLTFSKLTLAKVTL